MTESTALAAVIPLLIWDLRLDKPARVVRFVVDYSVLRQDGRWLRVPILGLVVVVLWYVVDARGRELRALAGKTQIAAVRSDITFRYLWSAGVALAGLTITLISEFSVWESFYTPLGLIIIGCALVGFRTWCDARYSVVVPTNPTSLSDS